MDNSFFAARHHALRTLSTLTSELLEIGADTRMTRIIDQAEERIRFMSEPTIRREAGTDAGLRHLDDLGGH